MTDNEYLQNLRLAYQEANRWLRHVERYFWLISSFWMLGSGFIIHQAIEWEGQNWRVLIIGLSTIVAWILFQRYSKHILKQSVACMERANSLELILSIEILPKDPIKGGFSGTMKIVSWSIIAIMCLFIVEFIIYEICEQFFNCCDCLFIELELNRFNHY